MQVIANLSTSDINFKCNFVRTSSENNMVKHVGTVIGNELAAKLEAIVEAENKTMYKLLRGLIEECVEEPRHTGNSDCALTDPPHNTSPFKIGVLSHRPTPPQVNYAPRQKLSPAIRLVFRTSIPSSESVHIDSKDMKIEAESLTYKQL